jgi:hypothetical protein
MTWCVPMLFATFSHSSGLSWLRTSFVRYVVLPIISRGLPESSELPPCVEPSRFVERALRQTEIGLSRCCAYGYGGLARPSRPDGELRRCTVTRMRWSTRRPGPCRRSCRALTPAPTRCWTDGGLTGKALHSGTRGERPGALFMRCPLAALGAERASPAKEGLFEASCPAGNEGTPRGLRR